MTVARANDEPRSQAEHYRTGEHGEIDEPTVRSGGRKRDGGTKSCEQYRLQHDRGRPGNSSRDLRNGPSQCGCEQPGAHKDERARHPNGKYGEYDGGGPGRGPHRTPSASPS